MVYKIRIRRQESQKSDSYWQEFEFDGSKNSSVANVLKELNSLWLIKGNKKKGKAQSRRYQRQDTRINCDYTRLVL